MSKKMLALKNLIRMNIIIASKQKYNMGGERMEFLCELYEKYTADLFTKEKTKKLSKKK
jgi:hypothetical protein